MKAMNGFVVACCIVIVTVTALLLVSIPAQADFRAGDYRASYSIGVNNNGSGGGPFDLVATDLHFSVEVKHPETEWFSNYQIYVTPDPGGFGTIIPHTHPTTGHYWKLDYSRAPIWVTQTQGVTITGNVQLNGENVWRCVNEMKTSGLRWTYLNGSIVGPAAPDDGFDFPNAVYAGPTHSAVYNYYNYDLNVTITLNNLSFYQDSVWIEPDSQWSPGVLTNPFHQEAGPFVLQPGDSISIALGDLPNLPHSYIYVAGEKGYQMPDFDYSVVGFRHGHEELRQGGGTIPTLTEWGLIIFGVVLLGFITWVFLRRRKVIGVGL